MAYLSAGIKLAAKGNVNIDDKKTASLKLAWVSGACVAIGSFWILLQWLTSEYPQPYRWTYAWGEQIGASLAFRLDGLSMLFVLLIGGIGALILIYGGAYLRGHHHIGRFYLLILMFTVSMLGLVTADNLNLLFVFWELTSLSSFFLIGFDHDRVEARAAALEALLVTSLGGLVLLAGFVLLGQAAGTFEISNLLAEGTTVQSHRFYMAILVLVLIGAFTKSAQVPFHFWLPDAMEAPTPVSAYLHSATMVKAGVYLLARLNPVLGGTNAWFLVLTVAGGVTMVVGALIALSERDAKRVLAYSTVSALGLLTLLIGIGTETAMVAAVVYLLAHAFYKGALFLVAGIIDHETGTRDLHALSGLGRLMPVTAVCAIAAGLSMAGLPASLGFVGKEVTYDATTHAPFWSFWLTAGAFAASALMVAIAVAVGLKPFVGSRHSTPRHPHDPDLSMWLGPLVLAILGITAGLWPQALFSGLLAPAAAVMLPSTSSPELPHSSTAILLLSGATFAAGFLLYTGRQRAGMVASIFVLNAKRGYTASVETINRVARTQTGLLQNGYLRSYLGIILGTAGLLTGYVLLTKRSFAWPAGVDDIRFHELAVAAAIVAAALAALFSESRFRSVVALGIAGYSIALFYIFFGAPDLAMTQLLVETLTVVLLVLIFRRLPEYSRFSSKGARIRDAFLAGTVGALMTFLVLAANSSPASESISSYFRLNSLTQGHGRNIVNVILVDFRALDTLGEITVLAVAGLGVYGLLKLRPSGGEKR